MRFAVVLLLFAIPSAVLGQDTFTPHHVSRVKIVTEAVIAPDGSRVAYVLAVPRDLTKEKDGTAWTELHVVDLEGASTPFVTGSVNVSSISWTPDGKDIAFLTKRDKDDARSLYQIGVKGGEARKVLSHATDIQGYGFSGDGKQIAFLATEVTPAAKKKLVDQGFSQEIYEEDQPFTRVWIAEADGEGFGRTRMIKLDGSASELQFNPKKDEIAVALSATPGIDDQIMFRKVHVVDLATGKAKNLDNPGKLGQLSWSPDGKKLAMITGADKHDPKEGQVRAWGPGSGGWEIVSIPERSHAESLAWKNDDTLMFQLSIGVSSAIGKVRGIRPPTPGQFQKYELILPGKAVPVSSNLSASSNGQTLAFLGQSASHPPEVFLFKEGDQSPRKLTNSNPWLAKMKFAKQEVISYRARDGFELEGVLIHPLESKPGQRHPLVLTVHGGPEAHYANGWLTMYHSLGQVAAAKGMAVFYPNYRGSTGYGVAFSMMGQKEAGGKEFDDLVDGVDHLIKIGLVDEKKVGITGGSYGGYATAWGATALSHRFAAGVMFVGISDWISCSGTTDIPQEMFLVHHRKWLWDDWEYFTKASPIRYLDKHKTPLLILHGKNDPRVHPSQSLELYRHLKVRNQAPVRLVLYPGEGHGNRRAASRLDYNVRLLQWMQHYLQGPGGPMPAQEIDYGLSPAPMSSNAGWDTRRNSGLTTLGEWSGRGCPCCIGW